MRLDPHHVDLAGAAQRASQILREVTALKESLVSERADVRAKQQAAQRLENIWSECFGWPPYRRARVELLELVDGLDRALRAIALFDIEVRSANGFAEEAWDAAVLKKLESKRYSVVRKNITEFLSAYGTN